MRRLLAVLEAQEEQSRAALDASVADLRRMEKALKAAAAREHGGRRLVAASVGTGELVDRLAGLEETLAARRHARALKPRIAETELEVASRREEFLEKRIERRRTETLIEKTEAGDAIVDGRRRQREVDDGFLHQSRRGRDREEKP
jgi:hypothetical protein